MSEWSDEESESAAGTPKDGELSADQKRTTLRWIVEVNRAAGLDGVISFESRSYIDFDEVDTIDDLDLTARTKDLYLSSVIVSRCGAEIGHSSPYLASVGGRKPIGQAWLFSNFYFEYLGWDDPKAIGRTWAAELRSKGVPASLRKDECALALPLTNSLLPFGRAYPYDGADINACLGQLFVEEKSIAQSDGTVGLYTTDACEGYITLYDLYHALRPLLRVGQSATTLARPLEYWKYAGRCMHRARGVLSDWRPDMVDYTGQRLAAGSTMATEAAQLFGGSETDAKPITMLVPGHVPAGMVTLVIGARASGKSTLAHNLVTAISGAEPTTLLGQPVKPVGAAYLLSGEDDSSILAARRRALDPAGASACHAIAVKGLAGLRANLSKIERFEAPWHPRLVVVDPARSFLEGSEDNSEVVSGFFNLLAAFAERTGAAVIVVHHLTKGARPRNLEETLNSLRGSGVFGDRPRVVIGVYRHRDATWVGVAKHNIPGHQMQTEARPFLRDDATLRLLLQDSQTPAPRQASRSNVEPATDTDDGRRLVLNAITGLNRQGERVTRTKQRSLYARRPPELAGKSRAWIEEQVADLLDEGKLMMTDGALTAPDAPVASA